MQAQSTTNNVRVRLTALILAAVLIALTVLVLVVRHSKGDSTDSPSTDHPRADSSACGLADGAQTPPTSAPATQWYFVGKIAAPKSDRLGPARRQGGLATCFARSPAGALFAAATIAAETSADDAAAERAARARIVPGELLDKALAAPTTQSDVLTQIAGFKIEDYTRSRTTLTLATRISGGPNAGALGATPMTLVWRAGDWWWELQPNITSIVLTSLDGFTAWSGVA
jgi:hypothetical protein